MSAEFRKLLAKIRLELENADSAYWQEDSPVPFINNAIELIEQAEKDLPAEDE